MVNKYKNMKKVGKAWIVFWQVHAREEKGFLVQLGISKKYLNILSVRKDFNYVVEYAKDIYQLFLMSFLEKAHFASYNKGERNKMEFFAESIPFFTHYKSAPYRNLIKAIKPDGIKSKKAERCSSKLKKYPEYVSLGHNPSIEIHKVSDLVVYEDEDENEIMEWNSFLVNGELKKERCKNGW